MTPDMDFVDMNADLSIDADVDADMALNDLGDMAEITDLPPTPCGYSRCRVTLEAVPNGPLAATVSLAAVDGNGVGVVLQTIAVDFENDGLNLATNNVPGDPDSISLDLDAFTRTLDDGSRSYLVTGDNVGAGNVANYYFGGQWRNPINGFGRRERSFGGVTIGGASPLVTIPSPSKHVWLDQISQSHASLAAFDVELTDAALVRSEDSIPAIPSTTRIRASEGKVVAVGTTESLMFWDTDSNALVKQTPPGLTSNIDTFAFTANGNTSYLAAHKSAVRGDTVEMGDFDLIMGFMADRTSVASAPIVELDVDPFDYQDTTDAVAVGVVTNPGQGYRIEFFLYLPGRPASQPIEFGDQVLVKTGTQLFAFDFQVVRNDPIGIVVSIWDSEDGLNTHYIEAPTL